MSEKEQVKTQPVPVQPVPTRNEITARQFIGEQPEFPHNLRKTVMKELRIVGWKDRNKRAVSGGIQKL